MLLKLWNLLKKLVKKNNKIIICVSFSLLLLIFILGKTKSIFSCFIYSMSAYSFVCLCIEIINKKKKMIHNSKILNKVISISVVKRYLNDFTFRGTLNIYQGMIVNIFYTLFRLGVGIYYVSPWLISMGIYYLILAVMKSYLIVCYKRNRNQKKCYRNIGYGLFLLNIPMGGMIILMIKTNAGYIYPGYIIYLSALYTFYTIIIAVINIIKFHKMGNLILIASKIINFVCALMSILGLQTAMITHFSTNGESYRQMMNAITGGVVYAFVIIMALYMIIHSKRKESL